MSIRHTRSAAAALALVTTALLPCAASARPIDEFGMSSQAAQPAPAQWAPSEGRIVRVSSEPAFDWGDAGIGAGAVLALTMLGLGGGLVVKAHRREGAAA